MTESVESAVANGTEGKEYRSIPLEVLREFYRDLIELSSLIRVAARAGIGRSTLQSFLDGASPHPRTRRLLGLYYLGLHETARQVEALRLIAEEDEELEGAIAKLVTEHHERNGTPLPRWLAGLEK